MKFAVHSMRKLSKRLPWNYCQRCGVIGLRNRATERALRGPCEDGYDAGLDAMFQRLEKKAGLR